ncbi:DUF6243 family protein [Spirillospora sp. NPDC047279]|uniref:DUF6243 family protein n=1 Tax=Spirillospora sp. NPDC047279 TaxID=3155478 RepID=UPI0033D5E7E2
MSKNRNGLLGVGGQRKKVSRETLRGKPGSSLPEGTDPVAQKKDLLRRFQERTQQSDAQNADSPDSPNGSDNPNGSDGSESSES